MEAIVRLPRRPDAEKQAFPSQNKGKVVRQILKHKMLLKGGALVFLIALLFSVFRALVV